MIIGTHTFDTQNHSYIMGILNVTPDSFHDGGSYTNLELAKAHVAEMIADGAAIIDVGGESTRPGYTPITAEEEIARVAPVIRMIKENFDIPISVDTYRAKTAAAAIEAGADLINDIWGLKYDPDMAKVVAEADLPVCIMHNHEDETATKTIEDVMEELMRCVDYAIKTGIRKENITLDPGVGFAKSRELDLEIIRRISDFNELGYPVLLGASHKRVIEHATGLGKEDRLEATTAITTYATLNRTAFLRVHEVKENYRCLLMAEALRR